MQQLVLATGNSGKLAEMQVLLSPLGFEVLPQSELGVDDIDEPGPGFIENALIKARHASRVTGLPAIADDSGLVVPALAGAPGVYSARYAGKDANAANNNLKLLTDMAGLKGADRKAYFICQAVAVVSADDPLPLLALGRWHGTILESPRGEEGFGYDPLFTPGTEGCSAAELPTAVKNKLSHRGLAMQQLIEQIRTFW